MSFFSRILAILLVTLSPESGEQSEPVVLGSNAVPRTLPTRGETAYLPILCPTHLPSPIESFFECLDETALEEEDSSRVEDHGLVSLTFFGVEASLASGILSSLTPASPHTLSVLISPILRC